MVCTPGADIYEIQSILCLLSETNSLGTLATFVWTLNFLPSLQSWILDDIFINRKEAYKIAWVVLCSIASVIWFVDAVVPLVSYDSLFKVTTNVTIVYESLNVLSFIIHLLFGIKHIVAFLAESHTFVLWSGYHGFSTWSSSVHGCRLAHSVCHLLRKLCFIKK